MLEITRIRTEKDSIIEGLKKRHFDAAPIVEEILAKDEQWRTSKTEMEQVTAELNAIAKEIGQLFQQGKQAEATNAKEKTTSLKAAEASLKSSVDSLENEITQLMYQLPNVPNELVKAGRNELDNETVFEFGTRRTYDFEPLPHWDLAKKYNLIDFETGVKITGAGFPIYKGKAPNCNEH